MMMNLLLQCASTLALAAVSLALIALFLLLAAGIFLKATVHYTTGVCSSTEQMHGKTVIITGGNSGIGLETAKELARRKARVILACRNLSKAEDAARQILEETKQQVIVKSLDLASFKSIRSFAADIVETEDRLDVLINNAGVATSKTKMQLTEDGCELLFQSNYLGHFLLTVLLTGLLKKSAPSRVINVSSELHLFGSISDFKQKATGTYARTRALKAYCDTKKAQVIGTRWLARKLKPHGITVNALHPGLTRTGIADDAVGFGGAFFRWMFSLFGKTPLEGAQTSLQLAVDSKLTHVTGAYFSDCKKRRLRFTPPDEVEEDLMVMATIDIVRLQDSELELFIRT